MSWYELEILPLTDTSFYPILLTNRSNQNAGFDLFASENVTVNTSAMIPFGISARLLRVDAVVSFDSLESEDSLEKVVKTESHFLLVPRSSIYKTGLMMANSVGVIDKSYRGELKAPVVQLHSVGAEPYEVSKGERLFQIVAPDMGWIRHVRLADSLPSTERGAGGFGSSGKW